MSTKSLVVNIPNSSADIPVVLDNVPACAVTIHNASPYMLLVINAPGAPGGSTWLAPDKEMLFAGEFNNDLRIRPQPSYFTLNNAPASVAFINYFDIDKPPSPAAYPISLPRLLAVSAGNISVNNATSLTDPPGLDGITAALRQFGTIPGLNGIELIPFMTPVPPSQQACIELGFINTGNAYVSGPHTTADGLLATALGSVLPCATVVSGSSGGTFNHGLDRAPSIVIVEPSSATNGSTHNTGSYTATQFSLNWAAPPGGSAYTGAWRALCIGL